MGNPIVVQERRRENELLNTPEQFFGLRLNEWFAPFDELFEGEVHG